ncbi:MAG TPA: hypothetical protein VKX45_22310 [Bryobacteraceae bacterium]|nr:hypothetical protein [Bryobacteraceae bacterium]
MTGLRDVIFRLYEQPRLRNLFYTAAFVVFVPVGFRFAMLAWEYGDWFDKPLAVIAGALIGITTVVTLMRFWHVPPRRIVTPADTPQDAPEPEHPITADDFLAAARSRAAKNRAMARAAAALGSTRGRAW